MLRLAAEGARDRRAGLLEAVRRHEVADEALDLRQAGKRIGGDAIDQPRKAAGGDQQEIVARLDESAFLAASSRPSRRPCSTSSSPTCVAIKISLVDTILNNASTLTN